MNMKTAQDKHEIWQASESRRFIRNILWLCVVGCLMIGGQAVRLWHLTRQADRVETSLDEQYHSVLGKDLGSEPFGRLQFEVGKLQIEHKVGLDPLGVMAALSRHDVIGLKIYSITLQGMTGRITGEIVPGKRALKQFVESLEDEEEYSFTLSESSSIRNAMRFTLLVRRH